MKKVKSQSTTPLMMTYKHF